MYGFELNSFQKPVHYDNVQIYKEKNKGIKEDSLVFDITLRCTTDCSFYNYEVGVSQLNNLLVQSLLGYI